MLGVEAAPHIMETGSLFNSDVFDDDDDSDEEDQIVRTLKPKQSKATKSLRLIMSDDDEESDSNELHSLSDAVEQSSEKTKNDDDSRTTPSATPGDERKENRTESPRGRGVGEEEGEEDDSIPDSDDEKEDDNNSDSSDSDDGIDEEEEIAFQLSPLPEAEQVEGGNSDERSMRRRRVCKADLQQIHSESQRIVRESSISIPYHKPKPLSLDELFNKKPSPSKLKPIRGRVPRLKAMSKTMAAMQQEKTTKEQKKQESDDELPDMLSGHVQKIAEETKDTLKDSGAETLSKDSQQPSCENGDKVAGEECAAASSSPSGEDGTKKSEECAQEKMFTPARTDVENDRMDCSSPGSQEKPKTTPPPPRPAESALSQDDAGAEDTPTFKVPSTASPSLPPTPSPSSSQSRRMQLLQESLKKLKGLKPKLSGGPQATIDLDEGAEPTAEEKGVAKLMKRFVKHTTHVKPTQVKEVQINVVTKEKGEDGKEDLKHHSICVGLDPTQEELDPALKIPGAKLVHLKENLQAQMKVRRESERQKRQEMFQLDNEEGFAGDDEDDAELTEGSETEEEEGGEDDSVTNMGNGDDDEEDEDYKVENEFVDDEAESDDDEEEEEGDEDEEDDDLPRTKSKQKARKSEKDSAVESDDEISPSRKGRTRKRAMVVEDEDEDDNCDGSVPEDKPMTLRLESIDTDDTDAELADCLQDSGKFMSGSLVRTPGTALDHSSKTMEMFDSGTNSTVTSDFQVPRKVDSSSKRVSWNAGKDTDSSKDSTGFALPIPIRQDSSSNSMDTSFEAITSLIPAHQPEGGMRKSGRASVDSTKEGFIPFSKHQSFLGDLSKSMTRTDLSLPVEDSQDLFREDSPRLPTITDSQQVGESQSFHFSFEDETQTQFLDENGLLNLKPSSRKSQSSKPATLFNSTQAHSSESQPGMEELLGLCSGQFTETQAKDESDDDKPGPFSQVSQGKGTQANMDELLDLCSGTFTGVESQSQNMPSLHVKDPAMKKEDNHEADADEAFSTVSFHIASDPEGNDSDDDDENKRGFSSDEYSPRKSKRGNDDDDDDDSEEDDDDDDDKVDKEGEKEADAKDDEDEENSDVDSEFAFEAKSGRFKGHTYGKQLKLANFVEEEAELSGSDMESDEDYDAEDEPDDEELEGIINEEMGDEDELRNQVNKVHMKTMDDDDARRLRIYKEMYLPDGDLHSENKGRTRRFRWKHLDSQMDMFQPASDGEEEEEELQQDQDSQWRLQRYQREQWLKEKEGTEKPTEVTPNDILTVDEHSQFAKCLRTAVCRKPRAETPTQEVQEKEKVKEKKVGTPKPLKIMTKRGSFLSRSKNDLEKMASMLKPLSNPKGPRNNRNFVFQSAEAVMNEDSNTASEPPKVKRSASVSGPSSKHSGPDAKRPRLERSQSQFTQNSVFRHF